MSSIRFATVVAAFWAASALVPAFAAAEDIAVTTTADVSVDDGLCSLREAIEAATDNVAIQPGGMGGDDCPAGDDGQDDEIMLAAGTYSVTGLDGENGNASGDFDLTSAGNTAGYLRITGALGPDDVPLTIIDAHEADRIFDVQSEAVGTMGLEIRNMILRNGDPGEANSDGGAILVRDDDVQFTLERSRVENSDAERWGGGMANVGGGDGIDIGINQVEFSGNAAEDEGGGLWVDTPQDFPTVIRRSAFVGNTTGGMGGAIYVQSDAAPPSGDDPVVEIENSTLSGNTATLGGGAVAFDFGLTGTVWLRFSTVRGNSTPAAAAGGGIATNDADQFVLFQGGNIVSENEAAGAASNCAGPGSFDSLGYNVESADSCDLTDPTDVVNTFPQLAALAYNAGGDLTTRTHALYATSAAVDLIPPADCGFANDVDQRGVARPVGANCDAGAYEGAVPPLTKAVAELPAAPAAPVKCKKKKKKKAKKGAAAAKKKKKKGCKKKKKKGKK